MGVLLLVDPVGSIDSRLCISFSAAMNSTAPPKKKWIKHYYMQGISICIPTAQECVSVCVCLSQLNTSQINAACRLLRPWSKEKKKKIKQEERGDEKFIKIEMTNKSGLADYF